MTTRPTIALLLLLSCGCGSDKASIIIDSGPSFPEARRVIVLVLDGVRLSEGITDEGTTVFGTLTAELYPTIREELLPSGARVLPGYTTGTTVTSQGHAELLSGVRMNYINVSSDHAEHYRSPTPLLFDLLSADRDLSAEQLLLIGNTRHLRGLNHSAYPGTRDDAGATYTTLLSDNGELVSQDGLVIAAVNQHIAAYDTHLVIANLHEVDRGGHSNSLQEYQAGVEALDEPIVGLWRWVEETPGYMGNTTLVLVSDHGRHSGEVSWSSHGDQCRGCREITMFFIGPDIQAGVTSEQPYILADVAQTIAHLLDIDLHSGTGQVMDELLIDPPEEMTRSGEISPSMDGGWLASQQWLDTIEQRSAIVVDDDGFSGGRAFHAEAPTIVATESGGAFLCWRQLGQWDDEDTSMPWKTRCRRNVSGEWENISPSWGEVNAHWKPAMVAEGETLWMVDTRGGIPQRKATARSASATGASRTAGTSPPPRSIRGPTPTTPRS